MKKIVLALVCTLTFSIGFSQNKSERTIKKEQERERIKKMIQEEEEGAIIFHRQTVFGIKLNSDGYGIFLELARMKSSRKANLYTIELGERKHPKEEKAPNLNPYANPYVFGKINNFYYVKLGFGQQRLIGNKGNKNGVAISAIYGGGFSAGLLKPYYLKIQDAQTGDVVDTKYNNNDSIFLAPAVIVGATGFSKGLGEMKFVPGAYAKAGIRFDYGKYNEMVSALEVGMQVDGYAQKMTQMALNKNHQLFFSVYAAIDFGSRK